MTTLPDGHPLSEELASLRLAAGRFQAEAHAASIKLQRHALDSVVLNERNGRLEAELKLLRDELDVLRGNPVPSSSAGDAGSKSQADTITELTLSLRRLSSKLTLAEESLALQTALTAEAITSSRQQTLSAEQAYALAARVRAREEEVRVKVERLEGELRLGKEEVRVRDGALEQYAGLVRSLEGRPGPTKSPTGTTFDAQASTSTLVDPPLQQTNPQDTVSAHKTALYALSADWEAQGATFLAQIATLEMERDVAQAQLSASQALVTELGEELGKAKFEKEQARVDDKSAAGMVERYMKFTTTSLHSSLTALRARHAATLHSLQTQLSSLQTQLTHSEHEVERLRSALDETGGALVRETVGRRREVALRVRMVGREERVVAGLRKALARLNTASSSDSGAKQGTQTQDGTVLSALVADVGVVLEMLDGKEDPTGKAGADGRMRVLENAVEMLVAELEAVEVGRRAEREKDQRPAEMPGTVAATNVVVEPEVVGVKTAELADDEPILEDATHEELPRSSPTPPPVPEKNTALPRSSLASAVTESITVSPEITATVGEPAEAAVGAAPATSRSPIPIPSAAETSAVLSSSTAPPEEPAETSPGPTTGADDVAIAFPSSSSSSSTPSSPPISTTTFTPSASSVPAPATSAIAFPSSSSLSPTFPLDSNRHVPIAQHPLLVSVDAAATRYSALQRVFKACNIALDEVRAALPSSTDDTREREVLGMALDRLHDYVEDVRVELEICVADGEVLGRGWAAIAASAPSPSPSSLSLPSHGRNTSDPDPEGIQRQITAFVERETRVQSGFRRKLGDVRHDLGVIAGRVGARLDLDGLDVGDDVALAPSPSSPSPSPLRPTPVSPSPLSPYATTGSSSPVRSPSPTPYYAYAPPGPGAEAQTFGSLMTSPARPRVPTLRSQASASRLSLAGNGSRSSLHLPLPNGNGKQKEKSVWEEMGLDGLRVPMPSFVSSPGHGVSSSVLPLDGAAPPRQRTMSGVYMLGLGAGSPGRAGAASARRPSGFGLGLGLPVGNAGGNGMKTEVEEVE